MINRALKSLGIEEYGLFGDPQNEAEFNLYFRKVTGKDTDNNALFSSNPSTFGVTWKQVSDQIKIEEQKYKDIQYQRDRAVSYPPLADVTVALAEKMEGNSTMWDTITAKRSAVKAKYPKP